MEEIDIAAIKKRTIRGVLALTSRTLIIQVVGFISNLLLTIFLSPTIFGVYFVVTASIAFLSYFSDIGLAAALIQKRDKISHDDLKTTFTIQQILVLSLVILALVLSRNFGSFYHLNEKGVWLFQALIVSFFLSSLKTIPSVILERNLQFEKLVIPQIVETLTFNILAVIFAFKGFGVTSFTIAVLGRGITGLIAMYLIAPWRISLGVSKNSASKLLSFGIPFQTNSFLALIKDDLLIAYLGRVLPLNQVGFIGFAQKWAFTPLRLIMDNIIRITFPSFSRLQDEKNLLSSALEKSVFASIVLVFPSLAGLVVLSPYFISLIPKYSKWEPALLSLGFFAANAAFSSISTPLTNTLNAIGKIKVSLYFMVFWTAATWILTPILIAVYGFNGVSIASFVISLSLFAVIFAVRKYVDFNFLGVIKNPLIATFIMGTVLYFASRILVSDFLSLSIMIILGVVIYFLVLFVLAKDQLLADLRFVKEHLK